MRVEGRMIRRLAGVEGVGAVKKIDWESHGG